MIHINVDVFTQTLVVYDHEDQIQQFLVSTSRYGIGHENGSFCTPKGRHCIIEKNGENAPLFTQFKGRVPIGIWDEGTASADPILTRTLRLSGLESDINLGGSCDTYQRYIYIHGTSPNQPMGIPMSIGCIRMRCQDMIKLYDLVSIGTEVLISGAEA